MAGTIAASPIDVISGGISEALITTQTGLIIGVPTFMVCAFLKSRHEELVLNFRRFEFQLLQKTTH
ncbi:MAG: MotA/TolQ/ExbB proton channel family protein [Verrucomicrobiales bacterium]